jgi:hypothetical protein
MRGRTALGGLPLAAAAGSAARTTARTPIPKTSRTELLSLLRRKAWQVSDIERHPVVLGVPLGQNGGPTKAVSIDIGLKNMVHVSVPELVDACPDLKEKLALRALDSTSEDEPVFDQQLLKEGVTVPMAVMVKEDIMDLPIASTVHPCALAHGLPEDKLRVLSDPFLRECRLSGQDDQLVDLVVEGVPGADSHVQTREEYRRRQRELRLQSP